MLCEELQTPAKIPFALERDLLQKLSSRLNDFKSLSVPRLTLDSLRLLQILSSNFDAAIRMATDKILMKAVMDFLLDDMIDLDGLKYQANELVFGVSSNPVGKLSSTLSLTLLIFSRSCSETFTR